MMADPIKNPGGYSEREGTNIRLDPDLKQAMLKYLESEGISMADYVNDVLKVDLTSRGAYRSS